MKPEANPASHGRDLAVMTLEIAGAGGQFETRSTVLCPCEQRARPLEECLPCVDSKGLALDPTARPGFVECLGEAAPAQAERREPGEAERSRLATWWRSARTFRSSVPERSSSSGESAAHPWWTARAALWACSRRPISCAGSIRGLPSPMP